MPETVARLTVPGRPDDPPAPLSVWLLLLAPAALLALRKPPWGRPRLWALLFLLYSLVWFASARDP